MKIILLLFSLMILSSVGHHAFAQDDVQRRIEERKAKIYAKRDSIVQAHQQLIMHHTNDSLRIRSTGEGNSIQIDNLQFKGTTNEVIKSDWTKGKIEQQGEQNSVDIQSISSSQSPKKVEIKQTGNNNKVVIRSGSINPK
ncbi:hypothetical protein [Mongoliitalea daihaiensis]|uniref:hypothetical protein n=1 Tax=Mongoliitalea daihaiensis TaxID=2782006 RepID=UPI001F2D41DA|nr:hypothetical protein [Mongoliitalea daihaiensis]UJP65724.1 hypothetical protein IPZ59_03610 [Mongoliitalea daihaiensis]